MQTSHSTVSLGSSVPTFVTGRAVTNAHDTIAITYRPKGRRVARTRGGQTQFRYG